MKIKSILSICFLLSGFLIFISCNNEQKAAEEKSGTTPDAATEKPEVHGSEVKASDVQLTEPLNQQWVTSGKAIYDLKCQSCHKLTDERVVGPGWKGVTQRRKPEWILNMITNVEMMLETDPEAQKLLEQCMVRMPNQNLSKDDSRQVLEFMRSNDGVK